jgi:Piercer of microtubule wall 1/2
MMIERAILLAKAKGQVESNPVYRTTSTDLGRTSQTAAEKPLKYFPKSNKFTKGFTCNYRNGGLNTTLSKSARDTYDVDTAMF